MTAAVWVILTFCGGIGLAVASQLVADEIRGRLDLFPRAILRLAARKLSASRRAAFFEDEWLPELEYILSEAESKPITRLVIGVRYAFGIFVRARQITRTLDRSTPADPGPAAQPALPVEPKLVTAFVGRAEARLRLREVKSQISSKEWDLWNNEDDLGSVTRPEAVQSINAELERIRKGLNALYVAKRQAEAILAGKRRRAPYRAAAGN